MPPREYQIIPVDASNLEDGVKDPKLTALRATGYRVVASLAVEHRGRPTLALVLEPPPPGGELQPEPQPTPAAPRVITTRLGWQEGVLAFLVLTAVIQAALSFSR